MNRFIERVKSASQKLRNTDVMSLSGAYGHVPTRILPLLNSMVAMVTQTFYYYTEQSMRVGT